MTDIVILDAVRSAVGRAHKGSLAQKRTDELAGEVLEAYVVLREGVLPDGVDGDDDKVAELQKWVKTEFAAHAFPRKIHFARELPKTPSGKIQRFLLRKERAGQN